MAEFRMIRTSIWKDNWFVDLRMPEQHLFLYLLTNDATNMLGVYQVSLRQMAFDTGIDANEIVRIFRDRFEPDKKVYYHDFKWVVMPNWLKHQKLNANQLLSLKELFNVIPLKLREKLLQKGEGLYMPLEALLKRSQAFQTLSLKEREIESISLVTKTASGTARRSSSPGGTKPRGSNQNETPLQRDIREARENSHKLAEGNIEP